MTAMAKAPPSHPATRRCGLGWPERYRDFVRSDRRDEGCTTRAKLRQGARPARCTTRLVCLRSALTKPGDMASAPSASGAGRCTGRARSCRGRPGTPSSSSRRRGEHRVGRAEVRQQRPLARRRRCRASRRAPTPSSPCRGACGGGRSRSGAPRRARAAAAAARACRAAARSAPARPGTKTSSIRLASETTATPRSRKPCSASRPAASWPLPPSITITFGSAANDSLRSGSCGERSCWLSQLRQPPRQHLAHRGEVVRHALLAAADREAPVVALLRRAALEDDHRGDGVRAHQVGDVEALDPQRQRVERQRALQLVERLDALLARALGLQPLLVQRQQRVALGELEHPALVAALGGAHLDAWRRAARPAARPAARASSTSPLDDDLRRDPRRLAVVLRMNSTRPPPARALLGSRGRTTGGRRARRRGPGRPGRWRRCRRPRRRRRRAIPTASLATRWLSSSERTARSRLRSSAACSYSCSAAASFMRALDVALDLPVAPGQERDDAVDRLHVLLARDVVRRTARRSG